MAKHGVYVQGKTVPHPPEGWCQTPNCGRTEHDGAHGHLASGHHCHLCPCEPLAEFGRCQLQDLSCACVCHTSWRLVFRAAVTT
jgi:hypothetical protein